MADNPNINYDGYQLPRDAGKNEDRTPPATTIDYAGAQLPRDAAKIQAFQDFINKPGRFLFNNGVQEIEMSPDSVAFPEVEKILVRTRIIDGIPWTEHVGREATFIEIRGNLRMQEINGTKYNGLTPPQGLLGYPNNIFPQDYINEVWQYVFIPNTVLTLKNSFLNGIGILEVVVERFQLVPVIGNTDVGYRLACFENINGPGLIITG